MSKNNQLKTGIILSYANLLIGNIVPFVYTPVMLRLLGQAEYGLYGIANSVMGYIGLLNFGIGSTIIRYISKYRAEKNIEKERCVIGLFLKLYGGIAVLILAAGLITASHLEFYTERSLTVYESDILKTLIRLMTMNMAVFLPFSVFSSVTIAHEQYVFNRCINILTTIIGPCLNLLLLFAGFRSVGLVISATILNLLSYTIYTVYSCFKLKIIPSLAKCERGLLKEIFVFSFFVFLASMVDIFYWATDKLIIGWAIGPIGVAVYNIGATFNGYVTSLSTAISGILMPKISIIVAKNTPEKELSALFIKVGRLQFIVVSFIVSAFLVFGKQFIVLWAGEAYKEAYGVAILTMIPVTVPLIQNTGLNILMVMNKHRFRSVVYLFIAILNVGLTFILVETYGIVGAAFATALAYIIGNCFIMNWYYHKKIGLDIPLFWKNILQMLPQMLAFIIMGILVMKYVVIDSWMKFLVSAVVYVMLYIGSAYFVMMNVYEKKLFISPIRKIFQKLIHRV